MSIDSAFMGTVARDAESKISKAGKPYARFTARIGDGDAVQWVSVMYFGADAADLAPRMLKGTRVYTEGTPRLDTWEQDGKQRTGISVMSWHCRVAAIGQHKSKRERKPADDKPSSAAARRNDFHNDEIPSAPEWR
jgi:single-stranded DNA-binding protein